MHYDKSAKKGRISSGNVVSLFGFDILKSNQVPNKVASVKNSRFFHKSTVAAAMQIKGRVNSDYVIQCLSNAFVARAV